jgi:hypothetical protein
MALADKKVEGGPITASFAWSSTPVRFSIERSEIWLAPLKTVAGVSGIELYRRPLCQSGDNGIAAPNRTGEGEL